jgi:hypothetical protein
LSVLVIFLQDGGVLGRLDDPGASIDEWLSEFFASSGIGQALYLAVASWIVFCVVASYFAGGEAVSRMNLRLAGWALSLALALAWLPIVGSLRLAGRSVPLVGMGLVNLLPRARPTLRNPDTDEVEKRRTVNPTKRPKRPMELEEQRAAGEILPSVHQGIIAGPGAGKNQAFLNYQIRDAIIASSQNLVLVAPKKETEEIVYRYAKRGSRVFRYTMHPKDEVCSALDLFENDFRVPDVASMICDAPNEQAHWREKAEQGIDAIVTTLRLLGRPANLPAVRDVVSSREELAGMRRISAELDEVADEPKEWSYIRSTVTRVLKPLKLEHIRRVFAARKETARPAFDGQEGRDFVILKPRPGASEAEKRLVCAALDVLYRSACDAGENGGPGTRVIVDEAASFMRLERLPEYLELGRGLRTQLTYVLQSTKQLAAVLGNDEAEQILASTDLLVVGATNDLSTARMIEAASAPERVNYRGPRQHDELVPGLRETVRSRITAQEVLAQEKAEWTIKRGPKIWKVRVPEKHYFYRQEHLEISAGPLPAADARPEDYHLAAPTLREDPEAEQRKAVEAEDAPPEDQAPGEAGAEDARPAFPVPEFRAWHPYEDLQAEDPEKECPYCGQLAAASAQRCRTCGTVL